MADSGESTVVAIQDIASSGVAVDDVDARDRALGQSVREHQARLARIDDLRGQLDAASGEFAGMADTLRALKASNDFDVFAKAASETFDLKRLGALVDELRALQADVPKAAAALKEAGVSVVSSLK